MFLSQDEIKKLTGCERPLDQMEYIRNNLHLVATLNRKKEVVLPAALVNKFYGVEDSNLKKRTEPNADALKKSMGLA